MALLTQSRSYHAFKIKTSLGPFHGGPFHGAIAVPSRVVVVVAVVDIDAQAARDSAASNTW